MDGRRLHHLHARLDRTSPGQPRSPRLLRPPLWNKAVLGRHFVAEDAQPGNNHVVILNNKFWRERFGSDPSIVGTKLRMSGEVYTVLGVAAPSPSDNGDSKMNVPLAFKPDEISRDNQYFLVMGKLKRGVTLEAANAEMTVIAKQLSQSYPKTNQDLTVSVEPLKDDFLPKGTRLGLWLMMGAVGFVLLIACVNIANLLLAWGTARQREIAVRASQGATGERIFRQFLIESLSLAIGDAACGSRAPRHDELDAQEPIGDSLRSGPTPQYPRLAFHAWRHAAQRSTVRMLPGVACGPPKCQRHVKGRRQVFRGRRPQPSAARAGGCRVRACLDFSRGRGTDPPQFLERHASRFGY